MLSWYARALEELGIPYEMSGGGSFANSAELNEIYKVLKAVADPKDPVVLVAALRGLFLELATTIFISLLNKAEEYMSMAKEKMFLLILKMPLEE